MESTDSREPSYYEVALTNRQVLVAFVVLLTCLLAAFLSGVWVGRGGSTVGVASRVAPPAPAPAEPLEQLTFFTGDAGARTARPATRTAPSSAPGPAPSPQPPAAETTAEDAATETMRRTLEAEMAAHREPEAVPATERPTAPAGEPAAAPAAAPPAAAAPEPGTRTRRSPGQTPALEAAPSPAAPARTASPATAPAAQATTPSPRSAPAPAPALDGFWIQVYASTNGERAEEITGKLRQAGFPVVHARFEKDGTTQHRVRVGPFATRAEAEPSAARLRSEQRLDTWITDTP